MPRRKDYTGQKFGRLVVIERLPKYNGKDTFYKCICECGNTIICDGRNLPNGNTKSCGCYQQENRITANITHGQSDTRLYSVWLGMKRRCYNANCAKYKNYGSRGIKVCDEWLGEDGFANFYKWCITNGYDASAKYGECTLDRIDNNADYTPTNCRFASIEEQANNKTTNRWIEFQGIRKTLSQWSKHTNLKEATIRRRIKAGWSIEKALTTPLLNQRRK